MIFSLLILALSSTGLNAQEAPGPFEVSQFKGLNTFDSSVLIGDDEAQTSLNIVYDKSGGIRVRRGQTKLNSTALDGANYINQVCELEQSDGDKFCLAFSSTSLFSSTDGCQTFTQEMSSITAQQDISCAAFQDRLYFTNSSDGLWYFDGTEVADVGLGVNFKYLAVFKNRLWGAGDSNNPSTLYFSAFGNGASWDETLDNVVIDTEDGDVITCLGDPMYGKLWVYKNRSLHGIRAGSPEQFREINAIQQVSSNIGCKHHRSVKNFQGLQYFDSLGPEEGQPGIYAHNGIKVVEASKNIRPSLAELGNFQSAAGRAQIDSKSDFDAGDFSPNELSSSREIGSIISSYTANGSDSSDEFLRGTFDGTYEDSGAVVLLATSTFDDFSDGDFTTDPAWTEGLGSWQVAENAWLDTDDISACGGADPDNTCAIYASSTKSTGTWIFKFNRNGVNRLIIFTVLADGSTTKGSNKTGYEFEIQEGQSTGREYSGGTFVGLTYNNIGCCTGTNTGDHEFKITRDADGNFEAFLDDSSIATFTDTSITQASRIMIQTDESVASESVYVGNVRVPNSTGSYLSESFDTAISSPIWGPLFVASKTANIEGNPTYTYETQVATDCTGTFDSLVTETNLSQITSASKPCFRYKITMETSDSATAESTSLSVSSVSFTASSTGAWTSAELFLSNALSTWGLFQTVDTTDGDASSITYRIRSSTFSGGTASASFSNITNNSTIAIDTGAYVQVEATFYIDAASDTSKTDKITLNWNEGTVAESAVAEVYGSRYYYCGQSPRATQNDVCFVFNDEGGWTKFNQVLARSLKVVDQKLVVGVSSDTNGGFLFQMERGDSDDGVAIPARWVSKDFIVNRIENTKALDYIYVVHTSSSANVNFTVTADGLNTTAFTLDFSTGAPVGLLKNEFAAPLNGQYFRVEASNEQVGQPWEILGLRFYYSDVGPYNPSQ